MNRNPSVRNRVMEIAYAMRDMTDEQNKLNEHPFVPGWQEHSNHLSDLIDNLEEIYNHPRKNKEVIYFLNELIDSWKI